MRTKVEADLNIDEKFDPEKEHAKRVIEFQKLRFHPLIIAIDWADRAQSRISAQFFNCLSSFSGAETPCSNRGGRTTFRPTYETSAEIAIRKSRGATSRIERTQDGAGKNVLEHVFSLKHYCSSDD
jgi:hypothetical protein